MLKIWALTITITDIIRNLSCLSPTAPGSSHIVIVLFHCSDLLKDFVDFELWLLVQQFLPKMA